MRGLFASHRADALYRGTTLVGPYSPNKDPGFSPWALFAQDSFPRKQFGQETREQGLNPKFLSVLTARLKSCPDTTNASEISPPNWHSLKNNLFFLRHSSEHRQRRAVPFDGYDKSERGPHHLAQQIPHQLQLFAAADIIGAQGHES
jgi:hypothetical protein